MIKQLLSLKRNIRCCILRNFVDLWATNTLDTQCNMTFPGLARIDHQGNCSILLIRCRF